MASEITRTGTTTTALYYFWFYFTSLQSFPKFYPGFLKIVIYRVAQKTSLTLHNNNGAYTLWGEISFGTFVDQYVLLLTY